MAYSRWSDSSWYIFWRASSNTRKEREELVVWHVEHAGEPGTTLTYKEVKKLLGTKGSTSLAELDGKLPGYRLKAEPLLVQQVWAVRRRGGRGDLQRCSRLCSPHVGPLLPYTSQRRSRFDLRLHTRRSCFRGLLKAVQRNEGKRSRGRNLIV